MSESKSAGSLEIVESCGALPAGRAITAAASQGRARPLFRAIGSWGVWLLAALLGVTLITLAMKRGIGPSGDSVTYYTAARSFLAGQGFMQQAADGQLMPLLQFPPGYSFLMAVVSKITGSDFFAAARLISCVAYAIIIVLSAAITFRFTRSAVVSGVVAYWLAAQGQLVGIHLQMQTEPLYLAMMLGVVALLVCRRSTRWNLAIAGLLLGAAAMTRFAAAHLIVCCALWVILSRWRRGFRWAALRRALWIILPTILPPLAWAARNQIISGHASSRHVAYHRIPSAQVHQLFEVMTWWVIPVRTVLQRPAMFIALAVWFIVPLLALRQHGLTGLRRRFALPVLIVVTYVPFLIAMRLFVDGAIPLNYRLLVPIMPLTLIVAMTWLLTQWHHLRKVSRTWAIATGAMTAGAVCTILVLATGATIDMARHTATVGIGYMAAKWQESPTIAAIRAMPASAIIYSNAPDAVYLLTDHTAHMLPRTRNLKADGEARFEHDVDRMRHQMRRPGAVVIYFKAIKRDTFTLSEKRFRRMAMPQTMKQMADAKIYAWKPKTPPTSKPTPLPKDGSA